MPSAMEGAGSSTRHTDKNKMLPLSVTGRLQELRYVFGGFGHFKVQVIIDLSSSGGGGARPRSLFQDTTCVHLRNSYSWTGV